MSATNGSQPETTRVDIGLRFVIDAPSYSAVGGVMDEIDAMLTALFRRDGIIAAFDFTHFNTHPCKAAQMERAAHPEYDHPSPVELTQF